MVRLVMAWPTAALSPLSRLDPAAETVTVVSTDPVFICALRLTRWPIATVMLSSCVF